MPVNMRARARRALLAAFVFLGLGAPGCGAEGGCGLNDFMIEDNKVTHEIVHLPGVDDAFAGVSYFPANSSLVGVRARPATLFMLSTQGQILRMIDLKGFQNTQGIAFMHDTTIAVMEATRRSIRLIDLAKAKDSVTLKQCSKTIDVDLPPNTVKGLQGLAYDDAHGVFYAVQERPPEVAKIYTNGTYEVIWPRKDQSQKQEVQLIARLRCGAMQIQHIAGGKDKGGAAKSLQQCTNGEIKKWTISDLAGIHFRRGKGSIPDKLWVLTQEGKAIFVMDTAGRIMERMHVVGKQPSGLVLLPGGTDFFMSSVPGQLVHYECHKGSEPLDLDTFHLLLEQMYNGYNGTISAGMSWYRDLDEQKILEVQAYLSNATVSSLLHDVNATLAFITGTSDPTSVAAMDVLALLLGLGILYCLVLCIVKITFVGTATAFMTVYRTFRWVGSFCIPSWRKNGSRGDAPLTYEAMSDYHDVELELGELQGLVTTGCTHATADDLLADLEDYGAKRTS